MNASEFTRRLNTRAAAADVAITDEEARQLQRYYELLERWNSRINLTSLPLAGAPRESIARLLIEPLMVAKYIEDLFLRWVDLGSGGGSPAIPIKIYRPRLSLTMVESKARKASFLREAVRTIELTDARVENVRLEDLVMRDEFVGAIDLVTARGVRVDPALLMVVRTLLVDKGRLIAFGSTGLSPESGFSRTTVPWIYERCST